MQGRYQPLTKHTSHLLFQDNSPLTLDIIPYDVFMEIVGMLALESAIELGPSGFIGHSTVQDISSLSLTSKRVREMVLPRLFMSVYRRFPRSQPFPSLPRVSDVALPDLVQELHLEVSRHVMGEYMDVADVSIPLILSLPNLSSLFLRQVTLSSVLCQALSGVPKLRSLSFQDCNTSEGVEFPPQAAFSSLQLSHFYAATVYRHSAEPINFPCCDTLIVLHLRFVPNESIVLCKSLRSLSIMFVLDWNELMGILRAVPQLSALDISTVWDADDDMQARLSNVSDSVSNGDRHFLPELTSLRCPPVVIRYFVGSPIEKLSIAGAYCLTKPAAADYLSSFPTLRCLTLPLDSFTRKRGDPLPINTLYPSLEKLVIEVSYHDTTGPHCVDEFCEHVKLGMLPSSVRELEFVDDEDINFDDEFQYSLVKNLEGVIPGLEVIQMHQWTTWTKLHTRTGQEEEGKPLWKPRYPSQMKMRALGLGGRVRVEG
jgi:hypothetical protein